MLQFLLTLTLTLSLTLALPLAARAAPVEAGQPLPELRLEDQHGQPWRIEAETRLLIFAAGRQASNRVQSVLGAQPKDFLATRRAVYLADMSRMPGLITRTFALPALREQPFRVGVSLDEAALAEWPRQAEAVTLIHLERGRVQRIEFAGSEAELQRALGL